MDPNCDRQSEPKRQSRLRELLAIVRRHLWLIAGLPLIAALIATMATLALPYRHETVATIRIDQPGKTLADAQTFDRELAIVRSRAVAQRVVELLGLRDDTDLAQPALAERWLGALGIRFRARPADDLADALGARLNVQRRPHSALVDIRFSSADTLKAARIVNAVAETYVGLQLGARLRTTEFVDSANGTDEAHAQSFAIEQLARETEELLRARHAAAQAKSRYEHARRMMLGGESDDEIQDILQDPSVRLLRAELAKVLQHEAELARKYGLKHPEAQKAAADVAKAQSELSAAMGKIIKNLKAESDRAAGRERQLQASLAILKEKATRSKASEGNLREALPVDSTVVRAAEPTRSWVLLERRQVVLTAAFAGLWLGLGAAWLLEFCTGGFVRQQDVEARLGIAHLAAVPLVPTVVGSGEEELRRARLMLSEPHGMFARSVGALRHELDARAPPRPTRTILIASAVENEGRTTLASNLALAYATSGRPTLLIDADLRTAGLTAKLGLASHPGLLDAITHGLPAHAVALRDSRSGLSFLPAGKVETALNPPGQTVASPELVRLLDHLHAHFEIIVLDAPPILPVSDARVLATLADQIVFVVSWRNTAPVLATRALRRLQTTAGKVAGVVINRMDPEFHAVTGGQNETPPDLPRFLADEREVA